LYKQSDCEPGSSVSIVSGYGLDDRTIEVRSRVEAKDFLLTSVSGQALWPTQPPVQWVPEVLSPGLNRDRGVMLTTHPYRVLSSWMSTSYASSPPPPSASVASSGTALETIWLSLSRTNQWTHYLLQLTPCSHTQPQTIQAPVAIIVVEFLTLLRRIREVPP
jgi:hypothetical protein